MERKSVFCIILLLLLSIVLGGAQRAEAQDDAETARDQLFSLVMGQQIGSVMSNAMLAYSLGKAARNELDALRQETAKCGDHCSPDLKRELHNQETGQAVTKELIDDLSMRLNMPSGWAIAMKNFFNLEPDKETPEQKAWNDMNRKVNTIATYCYTISDQIIEKQQQCEKNTPYQVARDFDNFVDNMCKQKVQKELAQIGKDLGMKVPRIEDSQVAQGHVAQCFASASYYVSWEKAVRKSCGKPNMLMDPKGAARWCIPDPTREAPKYKLISPRDVEFDWDWLNPAMWRMDVRPKVHECVYGGGPDTIGTAKLYFWAQEPPPLKFRTSWGGATIQRISDTGVHGEMFAYDLVGDGHYLGIRVVDKCPADLASAIRLRQSLLKEVMGPFPY